MGFWDDFVPKSYGSRPTCAEGTGTVGVPAGKWAWYDEDGNYIAEEGFYVGIQDPEEPWNLVLRAIKLKGRKERAEHAGEFKSYECNCSMAKKAYTIHNGKKGGVLGVGARTLPKLILT